MQQRITDEMAWKQICNTFQQALYSSCDSFFDSNGKFNAEGERATGCIRNGLILAGIGLQLRIPAGIGTDILNNAAEISGCGRIVKMDGVKQVVTFNGLGDIGTLLSILSP